MRTAKEVKKVALSVLRPYMKRFDSKLYEEAFNEHGTGRGAQKWRIYIPVSAVTVAKPPAKVPPSVTEHLKAKGLVVDDYIAGTVLMKDGRKMRMGRALKESSSALAAFENDPQRRATKVEQGWVVICRHPLDVIQMSYGRGWTSCMDLEDGDNKYYLKEDVTHGTLVAYYVSESDREIRNPSARVAMRAFVHRNVHILRPGSEYGSAPPEFMEIVRRFCSYISSGAPTGVYRLLTSLYDDYPSTLHVQFEGDGDLEDLGDAGRMHLARNTVDPELLLKLAAFKAPKLMQAVVENCHATLPVLEAVFGAARWRTANILKPLAQHSEISPALLDRMYASLRAPAYAVLDAIASSANVSEPLLLKLCGSQYAALRATCAGHFKITPEMCNLLSQTSQLCVLRALAENTFTTKEVLSVLAAFPTDDSTRLRALQNRSTPIEVVFKNLTKETAPYIAERADLTESQLRTCLEVGEYDSEVYSAIAANATVGEAMLIETASVADDSIISRLFHRRGRYAIPKSVWLKMAESQYEAVIERILAVAEDYALEVQLAVLKNPWVIARVVLARSRSLLPDVLGLLSNDADAEVLSTLAERHYAFDEDVQYKLLTCPIAEVRNNMAHQDWVSLDVAIKALREGATFPYSGARNLRERFATEERDDSEEAFLLLRKM